MFLNAPEIINISNNLGDAESLITHSATTTNQRLNTEERAHLGISDSMVHLSIGIEGADDIVLISLVLRKVSGTVIYRF